jgi:hypothetical protein
VEASSHVRLFFPGGGVLRVGYMAVGSILFLQEQIKDIIIVFSRRFLRKEKNAEQVLLTCIEISPAVS